MQLSSLGQLTNNKADPYHSNSLSFKNCMVRVPGSFNSNLAELNEKGEIINIPESAEVKIKQKWNAVRPSINYYLNSIFISQIQNSRKFKRKYSVHYANSFQVRKKDHREGEIKAASPNLQGGLRIELRKLQAGKKAASVYIHGSL